ncbi:hypothetical protein [Methylobacterium sp. Gmos1]
MATFTARAAQAQIARTNMSAGQLVMGHGRISIPAALATGDTIRMFNIPTAARVMNCLVIAPKIDNGTSLTLNVGDQANATRFFTASNVGQAGGVAELPVAAAIKGFEYTVDDLLIVTVSAGPTGGVVAGSILDVYLQYYLS